MPSTTLAALLAAYTDGSPNSLSLRMRTLLVEIARQIDNRFTAGTYHYIAQQVGGGANSLTITTNQALAEIAQFSTLWFQPIFNNTDPAEMTVDSVPTIPITSPTGAALTADELHTGRYYHVIFLGEPVNEARLMDF